MERKTEIPPTLHPQSTRKPDGWQLIPADGFIGLVGPFWAPPGNHLVLGVLTDDRHRNRRGVIQGGLIATLVDRAMGRAARTENDERPQATINLNIHYIDSGKIGEFLYVESRVTRLTKHVIFVDCQVFAADRIIATAKAIFKILSNSDASIVSDSR